MNEPQVLNEVRVSNEPKMSRSLAAALLVAGVVLVIILNWPVLGPAKYVTNITEAATQLIVSLTVVAVFIERALAVINSAWLADEIEKARAAVRVASMQTSLITKAPDQLTDKAQMGAALTLLGTAQAAKAEVDAKMKRIRVVVGFLFGLFISAAGIRSLAALVEPDPAKFSSINLFNLADIIVTAALLAGGSDGIAKLAELIRTAADRTIAKLNLG